MSSIRVIWTLAKVNRKLTAVTSSDWCIFKREVDVNSGLAKSNPDIRQRKFEPWTLVDKPSVVTTEPRRPPDITFHCLSNVKSISTLVTLLTSSLVISQNDFSTLVATEFHRNEHSKYRIICDIARELSQVRNTHIPYHLCLVPFAPGTRWLSDKKVCNLTRVIKVHQNGYTWI